MDLITYPKSHWGFLLMLCKMLMGKLLRKLFPAIPQVYHLTGGLKTIKPRECYLDFPLMFLITVKA